MTRKLSRTDEYVRDLAHEIFDMFLAIRRSAKLLGVKVRDRYVGFDRNDDLESKVKQFYPGEKIGCGMPMIPIYQRMLAAWRLAKDKENLTQEELDRIVNA